MNALELRGLTKAFPGFSLEGLDLSLPGGSILGLIGANGAGKTTTIKLILGMLRPDGGSVNILDRGGADADPLLREELGVVLDEACLPEALTPRQLGKVLSGIHRRWDGERYGELLRSLDIPTEKRFREFSRGNRMKLAIAAALSHHPRLLILDEPTSGLDPVVRDQVTELFSEFTRDPDHAVLISSHIITDLEKLCDYVAFLHRGRLLLWDEKDRLREAYGVLRCPAGGLDGLPPGAVVGKRESPYGVEAIVRRDAAPHGAALGPVGIEELFVYMTKEAG